MKGEIIGKNVEVIHANHEQFVGIQGKILDETKNILLVETKSGNKQVPKQHNTFRINGETIKGNKIIARPEDRIKK